MSVTVGTTNVGLRGTPAWIAPEILLGSQPSCASDVYSFGIVLYEIFSRQDPYAGESMIDIIAEVADLSLIPPRRPWGRCRPPPSLCPPAFADLMVRCTHSDPDLRPSFAEIVRDLRGLDVPSIIESMMSRAADNKHSEDLLHNVFPPRVSQGTCWQLSQPLSPRLSLALSLDCVLRSYFLMLKRVPSWAFLSRS